MPCSPAPQSCFARQALHERNPSDHLDPAQCSGRPYLRGLRIRVKDLFDLLASSTSSEEC
jgi:uncharacterized protein (DUF433 family)